MMRPPEQEAALEAWRSPKKKPEKAGGVGRDMDAQREALRAPAWQIRRNGETIAEGDTVGDFMTAIAAAASTWKDVEVDKWKGDFWYHTTGNPK